MDYVSEQKNVDFCPGHTTAIYLLCHSCFGRFVYNRKAFSLPPVAVRGANECYGKLWWAVAVSLTSRLLFERLNHSAVRKLTWVQCGKVQMIGVGGSDTWTWYARLPKRANQKGRAFVQPQLLAVRTRFLSKYDSSEVRNGLQL